MQDISLQPKQIFLTNEEQVRVFREVARSPMMRNVLTHAVAQFSLEFKPTQEQLVGLSQFIRTFLNIAEPIPEQQESPTFSAPRLKTPEEIAQEVLKLTENKKP